ncbi:MAG TPA: tetratricopeptide repeat protein, partial [Candidatus Megaira endosymbiont of Nemacystus decipiens]|nr:tetratricopeptide repeat protein [Candidatus Megaera endosymbiont of Nemacystus decipiens]
KGTVLGIKLHRLVQKKIFDCFTLKKDIMSDKEKLLSHLLSHLSELMPYVKESPGETWKQAEKIYPHIKCALQSSDIYLKTKDTADLLNKIAEYQRLVVNDFNSSLNCNKKALKIYKELNNTVPNADIAHCLNDLGNVCYSNSQFDDALDYYNQSLTIKKKIYKEDHPGIAISLNNLGAVYAQKGQYNTASCFHNQALEIRSAIYQEFHPDIAISLNNLASICVENAQYDDALVYYKQELAIKRQIYKEDHPSIADCLNSLGNVCWNKRQYDDALKYYKQALEINKKMYEENNANIANCLNNLANIYARKDKYDDALKYYKQALEIRKKIYEKNHPSIANILNNSGNICIYKGWYDAALLFHNQALGIRKKVYKMDHLDIANSLNNLKILFNNLGYKYKADSYLKIKNFVSSSNNFLEMPIINLFFDEDDIKMTSRITVKLARTLNRIAGEAKESNWCSGFFIDKTKNMLGDWGVQCFTADFYIREKLQNLYSVDSMEVSKLLCFEAICLGIASQTCLIKNYKCLDEFMEINPGIADVVLKKHPEYFVNTNLLQYYKYYICNQELLQKTLKLVQNMFEHSEIKNEELEHDKNLNTSLTDADSTNLPTVNFAGTTDPDTIDTVGEI